MLSRRILIALSIASACFAAPPAPPDGAALYKARCAVCHDGKPQQHMPTHDELVSRTPEAIVKAMFEGAMQPQSAGLSEEEGRAIAKFITAKDFSTSTAAAMQGQCSAPPKPIVIASTD